MQNTPQLPPQPISTDVLLEKYCKNGETTADEIFKRVAKALASVEKPELQAHWEEKFLENMRAGAIGAGRIMSAAGTDIQATLNNCYVQPVGDCIQGFDDDGLPGIYEALRESAETMRRGGGVGYDFSRVRPKGAKVKGTQSIASGPCSYMNVFDKSCETVESAGSRRGAQLSALRIDHPDVREFITAKREKGRWNNFNVSVAVSDAFMNAVETGDKWALVHKAEPGDEIKAKGAYQREDGLWVYEVVQAQDLWNTIMQSAYDFAEPGILFLDKINTDNNLHYCEDIVATNPCGEVPLSYYGCCDLGPVILPKFVNNPFTESASFDFEALQNAVTILVRFLDNVLDVTYWPLPQHKEQSDSKRRIGVGFTGLGDTLTMLRLRYDSDEGRDVAEKIAKEMYLAAYRSSVELAKEKGAFPLFDAKKYLAEGTAASRLPESIKKDIRKYGIRNSHLMSTAPTGTVSLAFADNTSNGIEPAFSWTYTRKKRMADGTHSFYDVEDHAYRLYKEMFGKDAELPDYFVTALEISAKDHAAMMFRVQPYVCASISKTTNVPADYPYEDFKDLYRVAWKGGLKGMATYRPNDTLGSVLSVTPEPVKEPVKEVVKEPALDPHKVVIENRPQGALNAVTEKIEYWTTEGRKRMYLIVSFLPIEGTERAIEFFMPVGQGDNQQWIAATLRTLALAARGGFLEKALEDLRKVTWDRGPVRLGFYEKADGTKVPRFHDSEVAAIAYALQEIISKRASMQSSTHSAIHEEAPPSVEAPKAPIQEAPANIVQAGKKCNECGAHAVIRKDGCDYCTSCGALGSCG